MTPKEKAIDLVNKYYSYCNGDIVLQRQCAFIAIEEIIESWLTTFNTTSLYWKAVKEEMQKL
jgi:hypothetical protein